MTISTADPLSMMEEAFRDLADCAKVVKAEHGTERKINKVILIGDLKRDSYVSYVRRCLEEIDRDFQESIERFQKRMETMMAQVQRMVKHTAHRMQGRSSGAGKSAAKKSTSASSSGGSDGDGDGPERTRTKRTKQVTPRNASLQHSPNASPGEIASPPRHSPSSLLTQSPGLIAVLCIVNWIAAILFAQIDEPQMAWSAIGFISLLIRSLTKPPK